ncbi:MAG TPA: membrane dipeptidase [Bacilli bacterium]
MGCWMNWKRGEVRIFDLHSDILYDLYRSKAEGINNRFENYHVPRLKNSFVKGGLWTLYSPEDFDLINALKTALAEVNPELLPDFRIIFGLEGLRNLRLEDLDEVYNLGIRHAMLTWNEENIYATGVRGNPARGITWLGKRLLSKMEELGMIIDLSHLNEKSFFEVLEYTNKNIIYSHGNVKELCDVPRNLSTEQMRRLKEADGLFGLSLVRFFISTEPENQNLNYFLDHLDRAVEIMGIDNVAFGFDFMDYLTDENENLDEVPDVTALGFLIAGMKKRGYRDFEIRKICYDNIYQRFANIII